VTEAQIEHVRRVAASDPVIAQALAETRLCADLAGTAGHMMRQLDLYCAAEHARHLRAAKLMIELCETAKVSQSE
jgi:hypothetical protein